VLTAALKKRFLVDQNGASAVEFALLAPVLIVLLLGIGDVAPAVMARYQVDHMTESFGDLAAEYSEMQTSDMVNVFSAASDVLAPLSSTTLAVRLTNIYSDGAGHAYVYWSCGEGALPPYTANSAVTSTPTGSPVGWFLWQYNSSANGYTLNGTNTSYIMAESQYVYTTPTQYIIKSPMTMTNTAYLLPRQSSYVGFPWDGVSTDSPSVPNATTHTTSVTLSNGAVCNYAY
jgi:Flp pilus assembly protein TadG